MMYRSTVERRGEVSFPSFENERAYMREFTKQEGLPFDLQRWQPTVDAMLDGVGCDGPIFIMIDQSFVKQGEFHRRPGLHIDGYWNAGDDNETRVAGHSYGQWSHTPPIGHGGRPRDHGPSSEEQARRHRGVPSNKLSRDLLEKAEKAIKPKKWSDATFEEHEGIILASNIAACRVMNGDFLGPIGEGGDCSSVVFPSSYGSLLMDENVVYAGNVTMIHETIAVPSDCYRTVVRLNVTGWTP